MLDVHSGHSRQEQHTVIAQWQTPANRRDIAQFVESSGCLEGFGMDVDILFGYNARSLVPPVAEGEIIQASVAEIWLSYFLDFTVKIFEVSKCLFGAALPPRSDVVDYRLSAREPQEPLVAVEDIRRSVGSLDVIRLTADVVRGGAQR